MDIDKKLVKKIATLSRIKIQEKEVEKFSKELSKIITWVEKLNEVETKNITPIANPSDIKIPLRKDEINDGKIEDKVLENAPEKKAGYFIVPKVVD
ncbi:MAG: Glutamyl-tRNA(Gln) amidotransferase subunit C [Alphaproteobacteria bacterium MarineAlpha6_Bin6]|nr:MAG: Glutamyl-tRNA(Gln) amidotransferase subunit C [Alphaproteobacteria bacterium MarineAlpha6_Bin6]PPR32476.1 MAG: Glutamyl-tRNA(Gln) amidotransferase subunit C [Alphaproteobacteria bacterium MarineAlpha6_Bin5]|tara:strand:- start:2915 stop:3202 length:288 start_codon:yes stop_codon:yes gene_type:complete